MRFQESCAGAAARCVDTPKNLTCDAGERHAMYRKPKVQFWMLFHGKILLKPRARSQLKYCDRGDMLANTARQ